ncbi:MAG: hypothetical protein ACD_47C00126G0003, partial [uncultured bacterium]
MPAGVLINAAQLEMRLHVLGVEYYNFLIFGYGGGQVRTLIVLLRYRKQNVYLVLLVVVRINVSAGFQRRYLARFAARAKVVDKFQRSLPYERNKATLKVPVIKIAMLFFAG